MNKTHEEFSIPDPLVMNCGKRVLSRDDFTLRREEIKELLMHEIYGKIPTRPDHLSAEIVEIDSSFAAGKATLYTLKFTATFTDTDACFKVKSAVPNRTERPPAIIYLSDTEDIPNKFLPAEEIIDRGYAIFLLPCKEITPYGRGSRFHDGLAKYLAPGRRGGGTPGKLAMWAWGAMRVMDYAVGQTSVDKDNIAVCAGGLLGISALIAGGYDERFKYVIANCAGTLGTALSRDRLGVSPESVIGEYPELFSRRFVKNCKPFWKRNYDQNFLLFLSLDRHLLIGSAELDRRGDPRSEFSAVASLCPAISVLEGRLKSPPKRHLRAGECVTLGRVCYHLRDGLDYFSREDWNTYLDYIDENL